MFGRTAAVEELAFHHFQMGLIPRISNIIRCKSPKSLNEDINIAISEEKIQQHLFKQSSTTPKPNLPRSNFQSSRRDQAHVVTNLPLGPTDLGRLYRTDPPISTTRIKTTSHQSVDTANIQVRLSNNVANGGIIIKDHHQIKTNSDTPITKLYRFSQCHKTEVQNQIQKFLDQDNRTVFVALVFSNLGCPQEVRCFRRKEMARSNRLPKTQ